MTHVTKELRLDARRIPAPFSVSSAAQEALRRLVGDDGLPLNAHHAMPSPDDRDAWIRMREPVDASYAMAMRQIAGTLRATTGTTRRGPAVIHVATPVDRFDDRRAIIDLHGGALLFGGGEACRIGACRLADRQGALSYGIDYRVPPEHPFPAALDDCMAAYRMVLERHPPGGIIVHGRSAGGNLAVAMLLRARDESLPMPAGLVLLSPQVDLTESGDSFRTNLLVDAVLPRPLRSGNLLYANGADLSHPYLSPLYGDLRGCPPTFLQSGTRDLFLSNTVRMHRALRRAGVAADLHVFEAMPHGGFGGHTPEDAELLAEIDAFMDARWSGDRPS